MIRNNNPYQKERSTLLSHSYIHGIHAAAACLGAYPGEVNRIYLSKRINEINEQLGSIAATNNIPIQYTDNITLIKTCNLRSHENHQGIALQLKVSLEKILSATPEELIIQALGDEHRPNLILCTGISDTHNLGAISRSAALLGNIHGIFSPKKGSAKLSPTTARISAGGIFALKYAHYNRPKAVIELAQQSGYTIYALEHRKEAINIQDLSPQKPYLLIIGEEERGIHPAISRLADKSIYIPQQSQTSTTINLDSLNMSVATGIALQYLGQ